MKAFKYFDLNNNGSVEPDEFAKAIEKIGIQIPTQKVSFQAFLSRTICVSFVRGYLLLTAIILIIILLLT